MPDDPKIVDMDPVQKMWIYYNWNQDNIDRVELAKNHAYLLGSFHNPEAVKKLMDSSGTHVSTDEDFEASMAIVLNAKENSNSNKKKRRKRRKLRN